jgi:hypothetical protein
LRHQLDRLREEHSVLTTSAVAEEQVATLTKELEVSRRKETSLTGVGEGQLPLLYLHHLHHLLQGLHAEEDVRSLTVEQIGRK